MATGAVMHYDLVSNQSFRSLSSLMKALDPRIGMLCKEGKTVYYALLHGYGKPETQGTLEEIEVALGLRPPIAPRQEDDEEEAVQSRPTERGGLRPYLVTITPKLVTFAGSQTFGESTERVYAKSRTEAIKKVRSQVREAEGTMGVPCTYRACLDDDQ